MCRLTAYLGEPSPVSSLLFGGSHPLREQAWAPRELLHGTLNADGWGVVWYGENGPVRLARPEPVWHAAELEGLLENVRSPLAVAALRNATPGLPVSAADTPPLVYGGACFALNGFVPDFRRRHMRALRSRLSDALYAGLRGVSDTDTLFLLAVAALERGSGPGEALAEVAATVRDQVGPGGPECQLTMVLTDGEGLAACRTGNREEVNSLYRLDRGALAPGGILLASEPLDGDPGWTPLPPHEVVEVRPPVRPPGPAPPR